MIQQVGQHLSKNIRIAESFFHEYGRRGHGAQVIVEGREEHQMVGEKTKTPKPNQHQTLQASRPILHHLVFPLRWVKRVKRKLMTITGPAQVCVQGKSPKRLQMDFTSRLLVTSGHTTVRQNKVTLQVRNLAMLQRRL